VRHKNHDKKCVVEKSRQKKCSRKIVAEKSRQQNCSRKTAVAELRQQIWKMQKVGSSITRSYFHIGIVPIVAWYGIGLDDLYRIKGMVLAHSLV
jgi:hypothetical protein